MKAGTSMRCSHCNKRRALRRPIHEYVRWPRCNCGRRLRVDLYRMTVERAKWRAATCYLCAGDYAFPHRLGSKYCAANPHRADLEPPREYLQVANEIPF